MRTNRISSLVGIVRNEFKMNPFSSKCIDVFSDTIHPYKAGVVRV